MFLYALTNLNHNSVCIQKLQPSCQQIKGMLSHCLTRTPTHRHIHRCILSLCLRSSGTQLFHSSYTTAVSLVPHPPMCPLVSPGSDHQQLLSLSMICWCWGLFFNPSPFFFHHHCAAVHPSKQPTGHRGRFIFIKHVCPEGLVPLPEIIVIIIIPCSCLNVALTLGSFTCTSSAEALTPFYM